jgi:hypothetical protein
MQARIVAANSSAVPSDSESHGNAPISSARPNVATKVRCRISASTTSSRTGTMTSQLSRRLRK